MNSFFDAATELKAKLDAHRQGTRMLQLKFPKNDGPVGVLLVANRMDALEGVSKDFQFTVEALSDRPDIELKELMGKMLTIEYVREDGTLRYYNGHVFDFRFVKNDGGFSYYDIVLLPWLAFLRFRRDNFMHHGKTVQEQTDLTFADYELADWKLEELGTDEPMTDACQFDESDYNYVHRRWEAKGWHYWYEHRADGHTLMLSADSTACTPIDGESCEITWQGSSGIQVVGLTDFSPVRTVASTAYAASSFDFKAPRPVAVDMPTLNQQGDIPPLEIYEYTGAYGFKNGSGGEDFVRLRMEEIEAAAKHFLARGDDDRAQPRRAFRLAGHIDLLALGKDQDDNDFVILEVRHVIKNNFEVRNGGGAEYHCSLTCIRKKIPWRPSRGFNSIEPKIYGVQTAIVVTPGDEEIYTDEYGRVRVQFHWDRVGQYDERSSAWVRVSSPVAGRDFGLIGIPRKGQEVVVSWLDGCVDRPLITGLVHDADNMPPRFNHQGALPNNKALSGWSTRELSGSKEQQIRFDDTQGEVSTQVATDHGATQNNQGWIGTPRSEGESQKRGEGFEQRTDLAGAIRAGSGLLISADARPNASGQVLDRQELIGQLDTVLAIAQKLGELSLTHEADGTDTVPLQKLVNQLKAWDSKKPGGAPAIAVSAPSGIAISSPNDIVTSSGTNLDMVAVQDANLSTGRKLLLRAAQGLSAFVHKAGMKLVAAAGKVSIQAHSDEIELGAAKRLHAYSLESLLLEAPQIVLRAEGA